MNVIHLLPDSVANQIAAGEVIQRPSSVIKELMENAIDAGATDVSVFVQDAGRTQIQVVDNGCGMTESDARLAFERHATSKISTAHDLYSLRTMGFRGEALASIAAVAQVELRTRREEDDLGVLIEIAGSQIEKQEPCATAKGSRFSIKNLFYNIPARRNFLKSDNVEMRHICSEFLRVALAHPSVSVSLASNGVTLYNLPAGNTKQRVAGVAGHGMSKHLLTIETETSLVKITGYIGTPETAKKTGGDQYFFANNRYMKSGYFHKAVLDAYKGLLMPDHTPSYFIYFDIDPNCIDVNVHPQKTEIKFDDEQAIWKILTTTVATSLRGIMPQIDFDSTERIEIPAFDPNGNTSGYNPFDREREQANQYANYATSGKQSSNGWENIYSAIGGEGLSGRSTYESMIGAQTGSQSAIEPRTAGDSDRMFIESSLLQADQATAQSASSSNAFFQVRARYIVTQAMGGLMIIDQHRAHERVLYERMKSQAVASKIESQMLLFPEVMSIGAEDGCILTELAPELSQVGIEFDQDTERGMVSIKSIPAIMDIKSVRDLLETMTYDCRNGEVDVRNGAMEYMLRSLARYGAMPYGCLLTIEEMQSLYDSLMTTTDKTHTPAGKPILRLITDGDLDIYFNS